MIGRRIVLALATLALGATGVEERDRSTLEKSPGDKVLLVAHFDLEDQARIAAEALPWGGRVEYVVGDEWKHRWREFFKPSRLGEHVVVRPPWIELPSDGVEALPGDVVVTIDPGQAFGTGTHETTRLVLAELDELEGVLVHGHNVLPPKGKREGHHTTKLRDAIDRRRTRLARGGDRAERMLEAAVAVLRARPPDVVSPLTLAFTTW